MLQLKVIFERFGNERIKKKAIDLVREYLITRIFETCVPDLIFCGSLGNERRARVVNRDSDNENGGLKSNFIFFTSVFSPINFNNKFPSHHATFETHYSKLIESEKKKISYCRK